MVSVKHSKDATIFDPLSGHGSCVKFNKCECKLGWTGSSCAVPDCASVNQCSGNGKCVDSNKCCCYASYHGDDCSQTATCATLSNCSSHGVCMKGESENGTCRYSDITMFMHES